MEFLSFSYFIFIVFLIIFLDKLSKKSMAIASNISWIARNFVLLLIVLFMTKTFVHYLIKESMSFVEFFYSYFFEFFIVLANLLGLYSILLANKTDINVTPPEFLRRTAAVKRSKALINMWKEDSRLKSKVIDNKLKRIEQLEKDIDFWKNEHSKCYESLKINEKKINDITRIIE